MANMKVKPIPWVKTEDMEWVDGQMCIALDTRVYFSFPVLVRDFGNGTVEIMSSDPKKYDVNRFTHYAVITNP